MYWGFLKRSIKFCYWILFQGRGQFFLQCLWNTDCIFVCCCMPLYLLKYPRPGFHIRKTRLWPFFSIQLTKHHKNLILHFLCPRSWLITPPSLSYPRPWKQCKSNPLVSTMYIYCSKDAKFISLNWNWNQILHSS